jgi:hypothetical protein
MREGMDTSANVQRQRVTGTRSASVLGSLRRTWGSTRAGLATTVLSTALGCGVAAAIVLTGQPASAETSYESTYGFDRTWNAALRMVRVDMGCKITEKDDQSGYLMFEYHPADGDRKKVSSGSMEFVKSRDRDQDAVRIVIQLPQMPRYHEQVMLDTLVRKMRSEYGDPPAPRAKPAPAPAAPPPAADAGVDAQD